MTGPGKRLVLLASMPKAGRTWLRFILAGYFNRVFDLGLEIDFHSLFRVIPNWSAHPALGLPAYGYRDDPRVPLLLCDHRRPKPSRHRPPAVLMLRSPHDVLVSNYFQETARLERFSGTLDDFVRNDGTGAPAFVRYHNDWAEQWSAPRDLCISYEQMSRDPIGTAAAVLGFVGVPYEPGALRSAVSDAAFERMRAIELANGFPCQTEPGGGIPPMALRAREGVVGGSHRHLTAEAAAYVTEVCDRGLTTAARSLLASAGVPT